MNNRHAVIALNMISGIGYAKYRALTEYFEEPKKIFEAKLEELLEVKGVGESLAERIIEFSASGELENELEIAERSGVQIITLLDDEYPIELKNIYDPPLCLYVRGVLPSFTNNAVAIVGSRKLSKYGERMTKSITEGAVFHNFIVVSGLAFGADYIAHKTTVDNDGITVGVLGGGLAQITPKEHIPLAREIIQKGGAVISEFPINFPVSRQSFPRRNRIVAALSQATIVVEAGLESGALITADLANEYGKNVFAVPGNVDNPQSRGCHKLIRNGEASLIENFNDALDIMDCGLFSGDDCLRDGEFEYDLSDSDEADSGVLTGNEKIVYDSLNESEKSFDELVLATQLDAGVLISTLMMLELKLIILKNPDKTYRIR